jgi:hypothetical protein
MIKYVLFLVWIIMSAVMSLLVLPAIVAGEYGWFELGDNMYHDLK